MRYSGKNTDCCFVCCLQANIDKSKEEKNIDQSTKKINADCCVVCCLQANTDQSTGRVPMMARVCVYMYACKCMCSCMCIYACV